MLEQRIDGWYVFQTVVIEYHINRSAIENTSDLLP